MAIAVARLAPAAGANADRFDGAVANAMVVVAVEVLGDELPIAGHDPFVHPADHLGARLPSIVRVQEAIEEDLEPTDVVEERRGGRVPGGPDGSFVDRELCDLVQT